MIESNEGRRHSRRTLLKAGLGTAVVAGVAGTAWLGRTDVGVGMGTSRALRIPAEGVLPSRVDVAVIGGGIVGACAALTLAERGISVALFEKGVIGGEASGRAMGYVDSQFGDPLKLPVIARSKALWNGMSARIGIDTGYRRTGLLAALPSEEEAAGAAGWLDAARATPGIDGRIVTAAELRRLLPGMVDPPFAALLSPTDANVEPRMAAPAIALAARRRGAIVLQNCAVRGLETSGGRVSEIVTEHGRVRCQAAVLAGGAWSSMFARSIGVALPQFDVYLSMMGLNPVSNGPSIPLSADGYGFRPQIDGGYTFGTVDFAAPILPDTLANATRLIPNLKAFWPMAEMGLSTHEFARRLVQRSSWPLDEPSPFEERRILVPNFRPGPYEEAMRRLRRHFPAFERATVRERWAGVISTTLDNVPVISAVDAIPGLHVGTGFSYGITFGPAAGEALADLVTGSTPQVDLRPYRLSRFFDGTEMTYRS